MSNALGYLKQMPYPGRVIIIGKSPAGKNVVMYAITGRSPSSQARRLVIDGEAQQVLVTPTDEETLKTGNPDLLVYPAIMCGSGIAVSNGKQTVDIFNHLSKDRAATAVLTEALAGWEYEPDAPNYTPRISGCITSGAGMGILKRDGDGSVAAACCELSLTPGRGRLIATYSGANENPLPSFAGEPREVDIPWPTAEDAVQAFYDALGPAPGNPDFRVAAACLYADSGITLKVKNRHP